MEGGGQGGNSKATMRQGMDGFLTEIKNVCRKHNHRWKLVCCGSRNEAYKRFRDELSYDDAGIVVLLVDSETRVDVQAPIDHLAVHDGWNFSDIDNDMVHLMAQTMETWIVADSAVLEIYYGQGFQKNVLPSQQNLEEVNKNDIVQALDRATQKTQKGKYHKVRHGGHLLQRMDPMTVRQRCSHCKRLFEVLLRLIRQAS